MLDLRGRDTVRITKVKGHADGGMVLDGRVREVDRFGNDAADEAADFGRRRVGPAVIDARRNLSGVCGRWYPVVRDLHRFFLAISRAVVNHDGFGGTAPDPMVWSAGSLPKRRRIVHAVRNLAMLPGPPAIWLGEWVAGPAVTIGADDVAQWPYTPGLLVVVFLMLSCSFFMNFGLERDWSLRRLILGIFGLGVQFQCRLFLLVQALIFGAPVGFIGAMMRSLCMLPGGLGRFVPCSIGANHCRLRHVGWERCSHGLASRPQESASGPFLDQLLLLFQYHPRSSGALRYSSSTVLLCKICF